LQLPVCNAILYAVNQPVLTTRTPAVTSRAKGNPMKANTRHDQSSSESLWTPLSPSATSTCRFLILSENRSKIGQKSVRFRECDFFNYSASDTYNFNPPKQTDFPVTLTPLPADKPGSVAETHNTRMLLKVDRCPFSLGEKARMRDKLVNLGLPASYRDLFSNTVQ
jgi:hypothetical protein